MMLEKINILFCMLYLITVILLLLCQREQTEFQIDPAIVLYGGFKIHCMKGIVQATLQNCVHVVVIGERQITLGKMTKSKCFVTSN